MTSDGSLGDRLRRTSMLLIPDEEPDAEAAGFSGDAVTGGPALFLPGPVPDRIVWAGWNHWRLTRRNFVPAPILTAEDYARMTPRQRRLHDLHRIATHSNPLIQETPMSAFVSWKVRSLIPARDVRGRPAPGRRPGHVRRLAGHDHRP
jgi:hypothetical protein